MAMPLTKLTLLTEVAAMAEALASAVSAKRAGRKNMKPPDGLMRGQINLGG